MVCKLHANNLLQTNCFIAKAKPQAPAAQASSNQNQRHTLDRPAKSEEKVGVLNPCETRAGDSNGTPTILVSSLLVLPPKRLPVPKLFAHLVARSFVSPARPSCAGGSVSLLFPSWNREHRRAPCFLQGQERLAHPKSPRKNRLAGTL
jgi:hypothetical protein